MGWSRCEVIHDYEIIRCYHCNGYNHLKKECKNELSYPSCSEMHGYKDCKNEIKRCVNCVKANFKLKLKFGVNHDVWDKNCKSYLKVVELKKNYYGTNTNHL